jgi:hypothetical protein
MSFSLWKQERVKSVESSSYGGVEVRLRLSLSTQSCYDGVRMERYLTRGRIRQRPPLDVRPSWWRLAIDQISMTTREQSKGSGSSPKTYIVTVGVCFIRTDRQQRQYLPRI